MIVVLWLGYLIGVVAAVWMVGDESMSLARRLLIIVLWPVVFLGGVIIEWPDRDRCTYPHHLDARYTATRCPGCEATVRTVRRPPMTR